MSARDEHDTVPPPAGEDDAYSAATKVGSMPEEVMAHLRAQGLMPDPPPPSRAAPRPSAGLAPRKSAPSFAPNEPLPSLSSSRPPPASGEDETRVVAADPAALRPPGVPSIEPGTAGAPATSPERAGAAEAVVRPTSEPPSNEGGDARTAPEAKAPAGGPSSEPTPAPQSAAHPAPARPNSRLANVVVAGILILMVLAFAMALLTQRG